MCVFLSFWCADLKNNFFKKLKNIILMHCNTKNTLKNNRNHTLKHVLSLWAALLVHLNYD